MKTKHTLAAFVALMIAALPALAGPKWYTDLDEAKAVAAKENKPLLVDFTGSDWCGYCIKLHAEVFDKPEFEEFAKNYVLVELDFPSKKPQPPEEKAKNKATQAKFGVSGFPTVLLLDAKTGEAYGRQSGYGPGSGPRLTLRNCPPSRIPPKVVRPLVSKLRKLQKLAPSVAPRVSNFAPPWRPRISTPSANSSMKTSSMLKVRARPWLRLTRL